MMDFVTQWMKNGMQSEHLVTKKMNDLAKIYRKYSGIGWNSVHIGYEWIGSLDMILPIKGCAWLQNLMVEYDLMQMRGKKWMFAPAAVAAPTPVSSDSSF